MKKGDEVYTRYAVPTHSNLSPYRKYVVVDDGVSELGGIIVNNAGTGIYIILECCAFLDGIGNWELVKKV